MHLVPTSFCNVFWHLFPPRRGTSRFFEGCALHKTEISIFQGFLTVVPQNFNSLNSFQRRFPNGWMDALQTVLSRVSKPFPSAFETCFTPSVGAWSTLNEETEKGTGWGKAHNNKKRRGRQHYNKNVNIISKNSKFQPNFPSPLLLSCTFSGFLFPCWKARNLHERGLK